MSNQKTNPPSQLEFHLMEALESGDMELVGKDRFRLTAQGERHAEMLMLFSAEALEIHFRLALNEIKTDRKSLDLVSSMFDEALAQSRAKDKVIESLVAAMDDGGLDPEPVLKRLQKQIVEE